MRSDSRFLAGAALLSCCLLFGGCSFFKSPLDTSPPKTTRQPNDVDGYLAYFRYASSLSGEELKKEYTAVNQVYAKNKNDSSRLQVALLLSLPNTGFRDDAKALGLLKEFLANKANESSQLKDFALLLSVHIAEHKRQEEKYKTEQSRNEELEQKLEGAKDKLQTEQTHSEELGQKLEELEQKLEALKVIEKSIIERQQSQPVKTK